VKPTMKCFSRDLVAGWCGWLLDAEVKILIWVKSDAIAARNLFQIFFVKFTSICRLLKDFR
jgi:hypothetical protein